MSAFEHDDKNERLVALDLMRAISIVMVVGVHALGYCRPLSEPAHGVIKFAVHAISVPVFFLVDGYLFARINVRDPELGYRDYLKKSSTRLLLPWFIFTVGYTVIRYIFELNGFFDNKLIVGESTGAVVKNSYGSVIAPQLYFLLSLFLIRLVAPLTSRLCKMNRNTVLVTGVLYILFYRLAVNTVLVPYLRISGGQEPILHAFWGMQFYLVGLSLYLFKDSIDYTKAFYVSVSLLIVSLFIQVPATDSGIKLIISQYLYLLGFFFGFSAFPINVPAISSVGTNTMGIYLLHAPVLLKAVSLLLNPLVAVPILSYLLLVLIVSAASYMFTITIKRIPYGSYLFGLPPTRINPA